jgi:hypothetical protein
MQVFTLGYDIDNPVIPCIHAIHNEHQLILPAYTKRRKKYFKDKYDVNVMTEWQQRWTEGLSQKSDKIPVGRHTYKWIPTVGIKSYSMTRETIQLITNHGSFGEYLKRFNVTTDPTCYCGAKSSNADHVLTSCPVYSTHKIREITVKQQENWRSAILDDTNMMENLRDIGHKHIIHSKQHHDKIVNRKSKTHSKSNSTAKIATRTRRKHMNKVTQKVPMKDIRTYFGTNTQEQTTQGQEAETTRKRTQQEDLTVIPRELT